LKTENVAGRTRQKTKRELHFMANAIKFAC